MDGIESPRGTEAGVDFLWGLWNGATSLGLLILHVFGVWERFPVYHVARDGGWYQFGFILGVLCTGGGGGRATARRR